MYSLKLFQANEDIAIRTTEILDNLQIQNAEKFMLAAACFDTAIEHHRSILLLLHNKYYGSALALVRPHYESVIRGLWLQHCANQHEIAKFKKPGFRIGIKNND